MKRRRDSARFYLVMEGSQHGSNCGGGGGQRSLSLGRPLAGESRGACRRRHLEAREYIDRYGLAKERKLGYNEAASNTHFLKQLDKVSDGISPGQLVGCKDCLRRTAGQSKKKANYVCNATIGEYVEVP